MLAFVLAGTGLATVVVMARLFGLDKGLAAGLAAGGLTQSAIIGTAGDAIARLGLAADEVQRLQGNVAVGYAVTYVFGTFGAIIVCVNILPRFMGRSIRDDAIKAEAELQTGVHVLGPGQQPAAPDLVGRLYKVSARPPAYGRADRERGPGRRRITIERVKRGRAVHRGGAATDCWRPTTSCWSWAGARPSWPARACSARRSTASTAWSSSCSGATWS